MAPNQGSIIKVFIAFSGDVVLAGGTPELYDGFMNQFDYELNKLNIPKSQRICIPGNHDVSRNYIDEKFVEHEGVIKQNLNESEFNNYILKPKNIFVEKFANYNKFEAVFADYGISNNSLSGAGWEIDENLGVYCLNTALCSSGGYNQIDDYKRLAIDTRSLQKWVLNCRASTKILIMHHPIDWLTEWAQVELKKILRNNFSLCLSGHVHDQALFHSFKQDSPLVECSAPPLLTNKKGELGYSIISVSGKGVLDIQYRQWTKNNSFVTGVNFSDSDDGRIFFFKEEFIKDSESTDLASHILNRRLEDALQSFSSQPIVWAEPTLSKANDITKRAPKNDFNIKAFISNPESSIIKAPPQFGLTCLAHYFAKEAWNSNASLWLYLDSLNLKPHNIIKSVSKELNNFKADIKQVKCIVLDSWTNHDKDSVKILKVLSESYKDIPIIVMQTIDDSKFRNETNDEVIDRRFNVLHLLALSRGTIRKVVAAYNTKRYIGDEDTVLSKVVSDLEVLNLHRTPFNCLTLLKVSEKYFDESPVNRTKMLEMVLFLLFNMDGIPTYKSRPDLKDCEYVLGRFCEKMIRAGKYNFTREEFLKELYNFCSEKLIDLEVDVVFDVLYSNNIIIKRESLYNFRSSYWIFYFAAQRMHQDAEFTDYIFEEKRYTAFPEIIEFYTGIDRRREDALGILISDLRETCNIVHDKVGLPDDMNPYKLAKWLPTPDSVEKMQNQISENVLNSKLPETVKDQYADRGYDQIKPYDQSINNIFTEYSLVILMQSTKAASRALRNSDYVNPEIKRELLTEILRSWEQMSKVLLAITPILAIEGRAAYDGLGFVLIDGLEKTFEETVNTILNNIPLNVVRWYKDDLFSNKMGPLLFDQLSNENNELKKHELILLLISERPRGWKQKIQEYISSISKNSFYLYDVCSSLCNQYKYSFANRDTLKEIEYLIKMTIAKHQFGIKSPGIGKIKKIPNNLLPNREINDSHI